MKATIKLDIRKSFGEQQGFNVTGGNSINKGPCTNPVEEWGLSMMIRKHFRDRFESTYGEDGYANDFINTIENSAPANIVVRAKMYSSGGNL